MSDIFLSVFQIESPEFLYHFFFIIMFFSFFFLSFFIFAVLGIEA
jgi:hypothetical protein